MSHLRLILIVISVAFSHSVSIPFQEPPSPANEACSVDISTQIAMPQPLILRPGTNQYFYPSNRQGQIQLASNETIDLWCSGPWLSPAGNTPNLITAKCVNGQTFSYDNRNFNFNQFECRDWPTWTTRRTSFGCFQNGILVEIGYQVADQRWIRVYTVCHDLRLETNWYVKYSFSPIADANQRNVDRDITWSQAGFFTSQMVNHLYTRPQQRRTIGEILNDVAAAEKFIESEPSDFFMSRGHLAAMTDFIFATEQRSTYHYLNAAPQWQTFNGANWNSVEISSRRLAGTRGLQLDVYTGTFGVTNLWNSSEVRQEVFLDWPAKRIPAPQIYYKVLVSEADKSGVVLIGVNNPYLTLSQIEQLGYIVCPDVSSEIKYVSWQRTNLRRGFGYACEIREFLNAVPHIPELKNSNYRLLV